MKKLTLKIVLVSFCLPFFSTAALFAENAMDQAQSASINAGKTFDGSSIPVPVKTAVIPSVKAPDVKADPTADNPPAPKEPGLLSKMGSDLKDHKFAYLTVGGLAAFGGFMLFGTAAAACGGLGLVLLFVLLMRNLH